MEQQQMYAAIFGLLHRALLKPPAQSWLHHSTTQLAFQTWPTSSKEEPLKKITDSLEQDSIQALTRDYHQLFIGPGVMKAPPNGSIYTDRDNLLFGKSTMAFDDFCKHHGIVLELEEGAASDHIGLLLGLLAHLLQNRQDLVEPFLIEHLLPWSGRLFELTVNEAQTGFYQGIGQLCSESLNELSHLFEISPKIVKLYY